FIRVVGERTAALLAVGGVAAAAPSLLAGQAAPPAAPAAPAARAARPAEEMVCELYQRMTDEQRRTLVLPWNHGAENGRGLATRPRPPPRPSQTRQTRRRSGEWYPRPQQELIERPLRATAPDEEGYRRITRNGTFDMSGSLQGCGCNIFGDPSGNGQYAW